MLRITTNPVEEQKLDDCYQVVLSAIYDWQKCKEKKEILGFAEAQRLAWEKPNDDYKRFKQLYENQSFEWAYALIGLENDESVKDKTVLEEFISRYFQRLFRDFADVVKMKNDHTTLRNLQLVRNYIVSGRQIINKISKDEHLGLIRYYHRELNPAFFNYSHTPALLEYELRKFGPLFAVGQLYFDEDEKCFKPYEHTIMVIGIQFKPEEDSYYIAYRDGLSVGVQEMQFNDFCSQLGKNSDSALMRFDNINLAFVARGEQEEGFLYRIKVKDFNVNNSGIYLKSIKEKIISAGCSEIKKGEDVSDLIAEEGYVYTAIPKSLFPHKLNDDQLSYLSLILSIDPKQALNLLETACIHKKDYEKKYLHNDDKENQAYSPRKFQSKRKIDDSELKTDLNESPLKKQNTNE